MSGPLGLPRGGCGDCTPDSNSKGFAAIWCRLEIDDLSFHCFGQFATMLGADIRTVAKVLGPTDLRMAMRYQHLSPQYLGAAMNRLDEVFTSQYGVTGADALIVG